MILSRLPGNQELPLKNTKKKNKLANFKFTQLSLNSVDRRLSQNTAGHYQLPRIGIQTETDGCNTELC